MKVAIIHYWLVGMRGGEKVLESLCNVFPDAHIYTHVHDLARTSAAINRHRITTTFIARLPGAARHYKKYLPLMPLALEQLDLRQYDLVISSESGPAKGVVVPPGTVHVCYCHSPMRYVWDMYPDYLNQSGALMRMLIPPLIHRLRMWDLASSFRVDHFIANSTFVAQRIGKYYRREAEVIAPPVETAAFDPTGASEDFYLMVGELVAYKRPDLAVEAFNRTGRRLVVIGDGEMLESLRRRAHSNISFLGRQPFEVLRDHYARCKALIFPGQEDFGIVPVEAMACGRPVIAYGRGGVLDSVVDGESGVFFSSQSVDSLIDATRRFESDEARFEPQRIANHARQFDRVRFEERIRDTIERLVAQSGLQNS